MQTFSVDNSSDTGASAWSHNSGNSLWGGFPVYSSEPATATYSPVYPGMLPPHHQQQQFHHSLMKIGECSVKPLGQ
jgi:hypothetical protein